ncbi:MAG TPA: c-type cytochrome, partial [Gemmatimonadaceae bacterium]
FLVSMTAMAKYPAARPRLTIHLDGHQWWWNASYEFAQQSAQFHTANEIHIPVGKTVRFLVTSKDVIHSFWVPQLQGKMDLIPGDTNDVRILARKPGTYRGQCAEFCGQQHARMGIVIVADDSATFERWVSRQLADGSPPRDSLALEGQHLFVSGPCAMCHTVRGTPALADVAPDLTHLASRGTIAAGTLPNTPGNLEAWIANAQALKPGVKMPAITQYDGRQLRAIAAYLGELK